MDESSVAHERVRLDGKFFRAGEERFYVRGVTYGGFNRNTAGEPFPEPEQVLRDLEIIRELGANTLRVYDVPPLWFLDAAAQQGLRFFVTVPWNVQSCFLDSRTSRRGIRTTITSSVQAVANHPAVFAVAIANEIPADIVRWSSVPRVSAFLDEVAVAVKQVAPETLITYSNFPPTEFLQPRCLDFITFNVFLHQQTALVDYLAHLQMLAEGKPLLLGECGIDARREGVERQAEILSWTIPAARRSGLAGAVVFSFTDQWFRDGRQVEDWEMGLTTVTRERKPAFEAVRQQFQQPSFRLPRVPRVSVVVATYNGGETLGECIDSLLNLDYPDYEVITVDDGSTDDTPQITASYQQIRALRLRTNMGLSNARNLGIRAATGEIIAFTDSDCRVDPDWLKFLVDGLLNSKVAGIGGPNLLPEEDSPVAALVMAAPGGPAHVMFDDRMAEHVPGCNMAFWKWALDAIGGFDPIFEKAGDDVDVCWRLQRRGWQLAFAPAGVVWHHRRSTVEEYLRQQAGYGAAEAMLLAKHPTNFNALGGARWRGRICSPCEVDLPWLRPTIYRGLFATGMFQTLYAPVTDGLLPLATSLEFHILVALPLVILSFVFPWLWSIAAAAILLPPVASVLGASRTFLPRDRLCWWSRPMLALLYYLQPLVRGAARYCGRLGLPAPMTVPTGSLEAESRVYGGSAVRLRAYWSASWRDRRQWIERIVAGLEKHGWPCHVDPGWGEFDLEVYGPRWSRAVLTTVSEATREGAQILKCRLRPRWTLTSHLSFWGVVALEILLVGLFDVNWRGWWVPVVTLGSLLLFLRYQGRVLLCRLSVVLDEAAREWGLTSVGNGSSQGSVEV